MNVTELRHRKFERQRIKKIISLADKREAVRLRVADTEDREAGKRGRKVKSFTTSLTSTKRRRRETSALP